MNCLFPWFRKRCTLFRLRNLQIFTSYSHQPGSGPGVCSFHSIVINVQLTRRPCSEQRCTVGTGHSRTGRNGPHTSVTGCRRGITATLLTSVVTPQDSPSNCSLGPSVSPRPPSNSQSLSCFCKAVPVLFYSFCFQILCVSEVTWSWSLCVP